jgi:Ni,Fe-hydrogenase I cytochrome b subunit
MKKFDTITAILFLVSCGFFIYHTAITEDVSRQVFWGILLLLNYIKGTQEEIEEKIENQNKDD